MKSVIAKIIVIALVVRVKEKIFFGFMASYAESIGALFIMFGLLTRFSSFLLFFTMMVASLKHYFEGEFSELAFLYCCIYFALIISGPGKYSVDNILKKKIMTKIWNIKIVSI